MKFFENFDEKLSPLVAKLDSNRYVNAMKEGMFVSMPVMMIGALFALLMNFPISGFADLMTNLFGPGYFEYLLVGYFCTISVCSLLVLFGVSRALAKTYDLNEIYSVAIAFVAYIIIMPVETASLSLPGNCGTGNTLIAIIVAILTVEIIRFVTVRGWTIKMPKEVPPFVAKSFNSLVPDFFVVGVFMLIRIIFKQTSYGYFDVFVMSVIAAPLKGLTTSMIGFIIITAVGNLTYWFGISPGTIG
ncbi:MAG: PTS sugar transporter subunit IIC [Erysipelotrichaceae bacterium]|nr:PTS sugar transporter subunit IIC [Erysipelotrichaceae bacterium]